jgi:hypothetical protein
MSFQRSRWQRWYRYFFPSRTYRKAPAMTSDDHYVIPFPPTYSPAASASHPVVTPQVQTTIAPSLLPTTDAPPAVPPVPPSLNDLILIEALHKMRAAEDLRAKAHDDKEAAILNKQKVQEELLRIRNTNRPAMTVLPRLEQVDDRWVAMWNNVIAEGDTPDQAYDNFDYVWLHGTTR